MYGRKSLVCQRSDGRLAVWDPWRRYGHSLSGPCIVVARTPPHGLARQDGLALQGLATLADTCRPFRGRGSSSASCTRVSHVRMVSHSRVLRPWLTPVALSGLGVLRGHPAPGSCDPGYLLSPFQGSASSWLAHHPRVSHARVLRPWLTPVALSGLGVLRVHPAPGSRTSGWSRTPGSCDPG